MCSLLEASWGADAETALDLAGDERFFAKSRGFALGLAEDKESPDQALYTALMESAGYASNRRPFRELARRVPIASIYRLQRQPPVTRLMAIRAMLLGAAGLLGALKPPEHAAELRVLTRHLPMPRPMARKRWSLFRVRPANHPVARINGMACLLVRHIDVGLVLGLSEHVRCGDAAVLVHALTVKPFIGRGRSGDMAVNVVLHFIHAYASLGGASALRNSCVKLYRGFPKLEENEVTREMRRRLGTRLEKAQPCGARRQQGLIHLYERLARAGRQAMGRRLFLEPLQKGRHLGNDVGVQDPVVQ